MKQYATYRMLFVTQSQRSQPEEHEQHWQVRRTAFAHAAQAFRAVASYLPPAGTAL